MKMKTGILGQTKHSYTYSGINKCPLQQCMYMHMHAHTGVTYYHTHTCIHKTYVYMCTHAFL